MQALQRQGYTKKREKKRSSIFAVALSRPTAPIDFLHPHIYDRAAKGA